MNGAAQQRCRPCGAPRSGASGKCEYCQSYFPGNEPELAMNSIQHQAALQGAAAQQMRGEPGERITYVGGWAGILGGAFGHL